MGIFHGVRHMCCRSHVDTLYKAPYAFFTVTHLSVGCATDGAGASATAEATTPRADWEAAVPDLGLTKAGAEGRSTVVPARAEVLRAAFARLACREGALAADNRPCMA
jgi:hypothetical protein